MGALKFTIIVESDYPPQIFLGADIGGAIITEIRQEKVELASAAQLAKVYNLSVNTIRSKLVAINQGTEGKCLYNPEKAHQLLSMKETKRGRKRVN